MGGHGDAGPRVCLVTAGEIFGGIERHVLDLAAALAGRGLPVSLLLCHDAELASRARARGIEPILLPAQVRRTVPAARRLADELARFEADVAHVHGYKATALGALAARSAGVAVLRTEHGLPEAPPLPRPGALRARAYALADRLAVRRAVDLVCYVSEDLRLALSGGRAGLPSLLVPNGIEAADPLAQPRPPELSSDRFELVVVGRLDPVKGHRFAIEAMAQPAMPRDARLSVIGSGPLDDALRRQAARMGVAARVRFLGFRRDAAAFVAHADALLMPSVHEGLPYALLEAMAFGRPIVASAVGGIARTVRDGETALLVPAADPPALAAAVARLRTDPALAASLGGRAQALQRQAYSLDAMAERYIEAYRALRDRVARRAIAHPGAPTARRRPVPTPSVK